MKLVKQSNNPVLRGWGNVCGRIADVFLTQSTKYGDMYELEDILNRLESIDDTMAWKDDE